MNNSNKFKCDNCERSFASKQCLQNHLKKACIKPKFSCKYCDKGFTSDSNMYRHINTVCPIKKISIIIKILYMNNYLKLEK